MWGSNLPVTRTPDAHWMTEARYRGQKVVAVAPDYADNVKFADEWLPAKPGTDAALAMAMGHVILKEFFVDRQTPYFTDYVKTYTDLPHLVRLEETGRRRVHRGQVPDRRRPRRARRRGERRLQDRPDRRADRRPGRPERLARPPLRRRRRGPVEPRPRRRRPSPLAARDRRGVGRGPDAAVRHPRRRGRRPAARRAGATHRRTPGHHRLRPAARPVRRRPPVDGQRLPGEWAQGYDDADSPYTPAWQEAITGVPAVDRGPDRPRVRRERRGVPRPLDDRDGRRHQPLVPLRHDLPRLPDPDQPDRLPGRQRRRLGALRRPGEGPADHRLHPDRQRPGLEPAAAQHDPDRVLVPAHQPVPLRPVRRRHALRHHRPGAARREVHRRRDRPERPDGLDAVVPDLRPQPARPQRRRGRGRQAGGRVRRRAAEVRRPRLRRRGPGRARQLPAHPVDLAGQPARLLGQGQRVLPQAPARHRLLGPRHRDARGPTPRRRELARRGTRGEARPADDDRLPADQHHDLLRRRPPGRHLVREARPQHHRHAPLRALLQPRHRAALADPHRLGRLADHRREVQRARRDPPRRPQGRRRRPAHPRHPGRDGQPARRRPRLEEGRVRADPGRHHAQAGRGRARLRRGVPRR